MGFGLRGLGARGLGFGTAHTTNPRLNDPGLWFRVSGVGFEVSGFRFQVSGFGFRVSGFGFRVSDFGFRASGCRGYRHSLSYKDLRRLPLAFALLAHEHYPSNLTPSPQILVP